MKYLIKLSGFLCPLIIMLSSCTQYVDIYPKGRSLLNTTEELDYVLNNNWSGPAFNHEDLYVVTNEMYPLSINLTQSVSLPKEQQNALLTYLEENVIQPLTDNKYDRLYNQISAMNVVIGNLPGASGDEATKEALMAEAKILRAYFHYLLVNIFAKSYDPNTATTDSGIAYVEDTDLNTPEQQLTIAQVYSKINADIDAAIPNLPKSKRTIMRPDQAFGYALKAMVDLTQRKYESAADACDKALLLNNTMENRVPFIATGVAQKANTAANNLFYSFYIASRPSGYVPSLEALSYYEDNDIILKHTKAYIAHAAHGTLTNSPFENKQLRRWGVSTYLENSGGIRVENVILVKAECLINLGDYSGAAALVNTIRKNRLNPASYSDLTMVDKFDAVTKFKKFAFVEQLYTYHNFFSIKRQNAVQDWQWTIKRQINDNVYELAPNAKIWIFPIPHSATNFNPNIKSNF